MIVMRHSSSGAAYLAAETLRGSILNGGDGWHAHPCQALLDLFTIRERLPGGDLRGRKVVILGDVLHSRVARSNIWALTAAGADLWLCGPATLLRGFEPGRRLSAVPGHGRFRLTTTRPGPAGRRRRDGPPPAARADGGRPPALHPRIRRPVRPDLSPAGPGSARSPGHPSRPDERRRRDRPEVAAHPRSVITDQVTNGVAVRMALLYLLAGAIGG